MLDFVHCEHCEKISWSDKKAGPQCTPDPVTAQHIRTVVSFKPVRNRPTQSLAPGTEPERPGSFCWTALQTCWRASWSFCRLCDLQCVDTEDKEFVLLFLFLTSFDFVTSFDICRQKRVQQTLCVVFFNAVNSRLGVCTTKARIRNICAQRFTARHENESWRIQKWVELQQSSSLNVFSCVSTLGLGERWREETEEDCSGLHFNFIQRQKTVRRVQWNMYIYIRIIEFNTPLQTKTWTK